MSSILDKIKTAINASLRGTRRSQHRPESPPQDSPQNAAVPEITDASEARVELPEVTDAPLTSLHDSPPLSPPPPPQTDQSHVTERPIDAGPDEELEDERIVDLLKDADA